MKKRARKMMMKIKMNFLGIGSGFNLSLGNSSAFFYDDNKNFYLIDCGFDVFGKIMKYDLLKDVNEIHVFITHLHDDHMGSLATLMFYSYYVLNKKTNIYFANFDMARLIKLQGGLRQCSLNIQKSGEVNKMNFEFKTASHCTGMPAYSLKLSYNDNGDSNFIYYSGDTKSLFNGSDKFDSVFASPNIQIYQEVTHMKKFPNIVHMDLATLCSLIPLHCREKVFCYHLGDATIEAIKEKGFSIPTIYDIMENN
jgi:hypothetical protein